MKRSHFCSFAKEVFRFHWKTKVFQSTILTFRFLNFSNGKTSFSASRESRPENVVKHNEIEVLFSCFVKKCSVFIGKQRCFGTRSRPCKKRLFSYGFWGTWDLVFWDLGNEIWISGFYFRLEINPPLSKRDFWELEGFWRVRNKPPPL